MGQKEPCGILVGDGDYFWMYWPQGKFRQGWEQSGKYAEEYERYQRKFYMKKRTPVGMHSIGHEVFGNLGLITIIDPSTFHGYTDSLQAYIDGVRSLGTNTIGGEVCDGVEVSIMKHQRSWEIWLARKDRLPRRLKQVLQVFTEAVWEESWSQVAVNVEIPNDRFAWSPPQGLEGVEDARPRGEPAEAGHGGPGLRLGRAEWRQAQAVQLSRPNRLAQQVAVWLTRVPRGDRESPKVV